MTEIEYPVTNASVSQMALQPLKGDVIANPQIFSDEELLQTMTEKQKMAIELILNGSSPREWQLSGFARNEKPRYIVHPIVREYVQRRINEQGIAMTQSIGNKSWRIQQMDNVLTTLNDLVKTLTQDGAENMSPKDVTALSSLIREYRGLMKDTAIELGQITEKKEENTIKEIVYVSRIKQKLEERKEAKVIDVKVEVKDGTDIEGRQADIDIVQPGATPG